MLFLICIIEAIGIVYSFNLMYYLVKFEKFFDGLQNLEPQENTLEENLKNRGFIKKYFIWLN